ncbi:CDP-glucose 4,6-dehydratase [Methanobrevibacter sp. UBA313]|uniref:CDP-glucose 4,6-dehydratase n=1 Tax=Methanobrevibacter sp. UBA313 TaxID=1915477 RepID=UPI0039B992A0
MKKGMGNYFKDKKVFITGNTGFKGSWLSQFLLNFDAEIMGFSNCIPTEPSLFNILNLESNITNITGDIRDYDFLNETICEFNPDIIFHLAAQPIVRLSYQKPVETYETNIMGTVNLLESVRNLSKKYPSEKKIVLNITSDKCYENKEQKMGYVETDCLGGYDPYSSSKAGSEIVSSAYRNSFFKNNNSDKKFENKSNVSLSTARAGNVIGGGDWAQDRLLTDCVESIVKDEEINLRYPNALRPWQHVLEAICGYSTLVQSMSESEKYVGAWNFGPKEENIVNVETLVKNVINNWGKGTYTVENKNQPHENSLLKLNINKSLNNLDWSPVLDFKECVKWTIDWYKNYYDNNEDMIKFTDKQIKEYIKKSN